MLRSTHIPYDPKVKLALPKDTELLPNELVLEGSDNKSALGESWSAIANYAMERREYLWGLLRECSHKIKKLGGEVSDALEGQISLRSLQEAKENSPELYKEWTEAEQQRLLWILRIETTHEVSRLGSFITSYDKAVDCEILLKEPQEYPVLFEYTEDVPDDISSIYYDCAAEYTKFFDRNFFSAYTPHGIKEIDGWLGRQIQGHRGWGSPPRHTPEELAKMIRLMPHLHPVIKSNLLHNLKNYTGYKGWDTPEHVEEQVRARGPLYSVPALDSVYTGV